MPYRVTIISGLFRGEEERERSNQAISHLLEALCRIDTDYLRDNPRTPALYSCGVYYEREPIGREWWQDVPTTLRMGKGDCEDLACWRAAEYRARGVAADPVFTWRPIPGSERGTMYHIIVRLPDGTLEDPSRKLGMR